MSNQGDLAEPPRPAKQLERSADTKVSSKVQNRSHSPHGGSVSEAAIAADGTGPVSQMARHGKLVGIRLRPVG